MFFIRLYSIELRVYSVHSTHQSLLVICATRTCVLSHMRSVYIFLSLSWENERSWTVLTAERREYGRLSLLKHNNRNRNPCACCVAPISVLCHRWAFDSIVPCICFHNFISTNRTHLAPIANIFLLRMSADCVWKKLSVLNLPSCAFFCCCRD